MNISKAKIQKKIGRWLVIGSNFLDNTIVQSEIMQIKLKKSPEILDHDTNRKRKARRSNLIRTPTDQLVEKK